MSIRDGGPKAGREHQLRRDRKRELERDQKRQHETHRQQETASKPGAAARKAPKTGARTAPQEASLPSTFTTVRVFSDAAGQTSAPAGGAIDDVDQDSFGGDSFEGVSKRVHRKRRFVEKGVDGASSTEFDGQKAMQKLAHSTLTKLQQDISKKRALGSGQWLELAKGALQSAPLADRVAAFAKVNADVKAEMGKTKLRKRQVKLKAGGKARQAPSHADITELKVDGASAREGEQQFMLANHFSSGLVRIDVKHVDNKAELASHVAAYTPSGLLAETMLRLLSDFGPAQRPSPAHTPYSELICDSAA